MKKRQLEPSLPVIALLGYMGAQRIARHALPLSQVLKINMRNATGHCDD